MARTSKFFAFLAILFVVFAPQVWAQSPEDTLRQGLTEIMEQARRDSAALQRMAAAMERIAQASPQVAVQPAANAAATIANCAQPDNADRALCLAQYAVEIGQHNTARYNELAPIVARHTKEINSLKGRIAPRQPAAVGPVASGPARVKMTAPAQEEFLSVAFNGDIPSQADLAGIKNYLGRYEVSQVIVLPAPGKDDTERAIHAAARAAALHAAYGGFYPTGLREPKDNGERDDLIRGAPKDAGLVFHLKLKTT